MRAVAGLLLPIFLVVIMLSSGCVQQDGPIGGERDEYGCLGPAGYSWDEEVGACTRSWELDESQKQAAGIAVDHVGYEKGLTVIKVDSMGCPGCFSVELEKGSDRITVTLEDWVVKGKSLTPQECTDRGGTPVNTVGGETCAEGETNIGDVTGFISPNVCCVEINDFESCIKAGFPVMESYPRQCRTSDGKHFTEVPDECQGPGGVRMNISEAMEIAASSECVANGTLEETHFCNSNTGTWWIDLDIEKEGCSPACVVNIDTGEAEINWRCTGLLG